MSTDNEVANLLDLPTLTNLARKATGRDSLHIHEWRATVLHGGGGASTTAIARVAGLGQDGTAIIPWSFVGKMLAPQGGAEHPQSLAYWKRELLAYTSELFTTFPPSLTAPRCLGLVEGSQGSRLLCLEDLGDICGTRWTLADYELAASILGRWNGANLSTGSPFRADWLSRGWLRQWATINQPQLDRVPDLLDHPLVARLFPRDSFQRLVTLWQSRETLLLASESLPHVTSHGDAVRRNLALLDNRTLVALDWSFVGTAPVGTDLASLIWGSLLLGDLEIDEAKAIEGSAFECYARAVQEGGPVALQDIRLGYLLAAVLRYLVYGVIRLDILLDARKHAWVEKTVGYSIGKFADRVARVRELICVRADEAQSLLS